MLLLSASGTGRYYSESDIYIGPVTGQLTVKSSLSTPGREGLLAPGGLPAPQTYFSGAIPESEDNNSNHDNAEILFDSLNV